jgi:hypothetical protein
VGGAGLQEVQVQGSKGWEFFGGTGNKIDTEVCVC